MTSTRPGSGRAGTAEPVSRRRRRSLTAALLTLVLVLALGGLAIGGVVALLNALDRTPTTTACTADGYQLAPDQAANAALLVGTAVRRELPARAGTIAIATAMQESRMRNIDYGDRDSLGMFQQRPSQGWGTPEQVMDPVYAVNIFYDHLVQVPGYTEIAVTEAAQAVQRSAFPDAYAQHESLARAFASALSGWSVASLTCTLPDSEVAPAEVPAAVAARLERDFGITATIRPEDSVPGGAEVVADLGTSAEPERLAWAVAQASVAAASQTGAGRVTVGTWVWERSAGAWREAAPDEATPALGQVVVTAP